MRRFMALVVVTAWKWDDRRTVHHLTGRPLLKNVSFVHVPRTGKAFVYTLFRGACRYATQPSYEPRRMIEFIRSHCPQAFSYYFEHIRMPLMVRAGGALDPNVAYVALLRKPWRRTLAGLYHGFDDCPAMQTVLNIRKNDTFNYSRLEAAHVMEYADCVTACHVHLFTASRCGFRWKKNWKHNPEYERLPPRPDYDRRVKEAIDRMYLFKFVGITDHWDATLLLFSAMFDVPPVAADRINVDLDDRLPDRPAWPRDMLKVADHVDDPLYDSAMRRFSNDVRDLIAVLELNVRQGPSQALRALTTVLERDDVAPASPSTDVGRFPGVRFIARYISGFLRLP